MYHPLVQQLQDFLTKHHAWFETFQHAAVRTSEEAASLRVGYTIEQGSKALILQIKLRGGQKICVMCVLPGNRKLISKKVRDLTNATEFRFATEEEVATLTNGVQIGGIPPFGNVFGLPVYVDAHLLSNEKIIFNAGDRKFSIAMMLKDYLEIVKPFVGEFTEPK